MTKTNTRTLSLVGAIMLGVGSMVGAGIFALLGEAGQVAGSAVWLSFLIGGVVSLLQGYSFAKLGTRYPSRGGTIVYVGQGFGLGHLTGSAAWLLLITLIVVSAMVAISFGSYGAALLFGEDADPWLAKALAILVVAAVMFVNLAGSSAVAKLTSLVAVMVAILVVFSVAGLTQADPALLHPSTYPPFRQIFGSVALTFFAFLGFGVIAFSAEDIKDPARNLPRAMYAAIVIATIIYVAIALSVFGVLTLDEVIAAGDNALAVAAYPIFGQVGFTVMSLMALLATSTSLNANLYAATGASIALGDRGIFPPILGRPAGRGGSVGLVISAVVTAVIAVTLDLASIAALGSAVSLIVFFIASLAHLRVRHETGARTGIIWLAAMSAAVTFVAFVVSTWLDSPITIVLIAFCVVIAIVLDQVWTRRRDSGTTSMPLGNPPHP